MWQLTLGLVLWMGAHFFKIFMPDARVRLDEKLGTGAAKGLMAALMFIGIILMVIGYRAWSAPLLYAAPSWGAGVNALLSFAAVILLGLGNSKSRFRNKLRHPMLTGVMLWSIGHLFANGGADTVLLFGGMFLWALLSIIGINRRDGAWTPPVLTAENSSAKGDIKLIVISIVVTAVIVGIHIWIMR